MPQSRIAILYQGDDFGRAYLDGLKAGLGNRATEMIVSAQSFQLSDPTVDSQTLTLAASKADVLLIAATTKQTVQALKELGGSQLAASALRLVRSGIARADLFAGRA